MVVRVSIKHRHFQVIALDTLAVDAAVPGARDDGCRSTRTRAAGLGRAGEEDKVLAATACPTVRVNMVGPPLSSAGRSPHVRPTRVDGIVPPTLG